MAEIDPRIIELIDTLVAAGADWLAFELLDGIRLGRPVEDAESRKWGSAWEDEGLSVQERQLRETAMEPIHGDEQIEFAATYVVERITEALEMTRLSLDNLNQVFANFRGDSIESRWPDAAIILGLEDSEFRFTRGQAEQLFHLLHALRTSLFDWSTRVRRKDSER